MRYVEPKKTGVARGFFQGGAIQWIALTVLIVAMFSASRRAAVPAIMALLKFLWPVVVLWLLWRMIKAKITGTVQKFQQQVVDAAQQGGMSGPGASRFRNAAGPAGGEVLDLCANCGTLLVAGHRCAKP